MIKTNIIEAILQGVVEVKKHHISGKKSVNYSTDTRYYLLCCTLLKWYVSRLPPDPAIYIHHGSGTRLALFQGVLHPLVKWLTPPTPLTGCILSGHSFHTHRVLREKTRLSVTSKGRFGSEEEKVGPMGSSSRRRSVPRNLASVTMTGCESVMVQALRLEEQQRAKEERR